METDPASGMGKYDEPRSFLGDGHARRCIRLRRVSPCLEMPRCRAAVASLGVGLSRRGVPREIVRDIFALAFDLPSEAERRAEAASDDAFLADGGMVEGIRARHAAEFELFAEDPKAAREKEWGKRISLLGDVERLKASVGTSASSSTSATSSHDRIRRCSPMRWRRPSAKRWLDRRA